MLAFLLMTALFGVSKEAVYKVGDSAGRTMMDNVDYDNWASNKNFHAGDIIKVDVLVTTSSFRSSGSPTSAPYASPPSTMTMTPSIPAKNCASSLPSFERWPALAVLILFVAYFHTS
ncbi:hypothetical protein Q3G72_013241 [Acer saccharum]|nr:hypothetical protein Q3G72_013241 [Acer saccharum]